MPCPTHDELLALAFDKLDDGNAIGGHVSDCHKCRERLNSYVNVLRGLQHADRGQAKASAHADCLDDNDLVAYVDGGLAEDDVARVETHMVKCARCLDEFVELNSVLSEVRDEPNTPIAFVLELARESLRLVSHPLEGFTPARLASAKVLGSGDAGTESAGRIAAWTQAFGNYTVRISTTQIDATHATVALIVEERGEPLAGATLYLRSGGRTLQSEVLGERGEASIESLAAGGYECAIAPPRQTAITFELTILDTTDG